MAWSEDVLLSPEGEDWRVPVSELEERQSDLASALAAAGMSGALIQNPVDLYYYAGGRQNATLLVSAEGVVTQFVRRSTRRALHEAGGDDAPHEVVAFPRMANFSDELKMRGIGQLDGSVLGMQSQSIPAAFSRRFTNALNEVAKLTDCSGIVHAQREVKSEWEIEQMRVGAEVQLTMFEAIAEIGGEDVTELELSAAAEAISRAAGFGGNIQLRRFPMQCDRAVIVAGRAGGIPSFFDAAVGGTGPHPSAGMGAGFNKVKAGEPVLVDILHAHRGYIVDMTRMFSLGPLDEIWQNRLEDMLAVKDVVVDVLDQGKTCAQAWQEGSALAEEMGHSANLMGMQPEQAQFLGHSLGLELDESPVVAAGFDRPLPLGGTMAIEPKVVYAEGAVGSEDTWVRGEHGMEPISADGAFPWHHEW
ncbi:MAG: M24 family metallopeptidase [Candidatus Poseidoniaceae archaeon]|nr:M24 family metallopeptidase [Candidatus Poseidoniaceae archaeon]